MLKQLLRVQQQTLDLIFWRVLPCTWQVNVYGAPHNLVVKMVRCIDIPITYNTLK